MLERKKLNKLVVMTLSSSNNNQKASEIYETIKETQPEILREETVRSFKSFVKIINSFQEIEATGTCIKQYSLKKNTEIIENHNI